MGEGSDERVADEDMRFWKEEGKEKSCRVEEAMVLGCRDEVLSNGGVGMEVVYNELCLNLLNLNNTMAMLQQTHYSVSKSIHHRHGACHSL